MSEQRWRADIRATAEALIQVAEAEVRADGGRPVSVEVRDILSRTLTRELSVPFRETRVTAAEHIAKIKMQIRLLADGVIAITRSGPSSSAGQTATTPDSKPINGKQASLDALNAQRRRTEDTWNAAIAKMSTAWMAGRDADRRLIVMGHEPERRWRARVLSD